MSKLSCLDAYCGGGGSGSGFHQAGFDVVGVDINPQPHYPFEFHQADALEFIAKYGKEFDLINTSPPCQHDSEMTPIKYRKNHPDLIEPTRNELLKTGRPFVIENVKGARRKLHNPVMLCGSMFGLKIWRHRFFEIWPQLFILTPPCRHDFKPILITDNGGPNANGPGKPRKRTPIHVKREAIEISWMTGEEITEAVPPIYTKWLGEILIARLVLRQPNNSLQPNGLRCNF